MSDIITLDQAKKHLQLEHTSAHDEDLLLKMEEATGLCLDYLKNRVGSSEVQTERYEAIDAWDDETAPAQVRAAILRMTAYLFGPRGDQERKRDDSGELPGDVTMLLKRLRDPALA